MNHNKITHVSAHPVQGRSAAGLKGQLFAEVLSGVDLFVGPNGAGKSTRGVVALLACMEGLATVPTDDRRPYLGATLPENTGVTLTVQTGDGIVKVTRDIGTNSRKHQTQASAIAREHIGRLPTAWTLSDFATGTPATRRRLLSATAEAGSVIEAWDATTAIRHATSKLDAEGHDSIVIIACDSELTTTDRTDGSAWVRDAKTWLEGARLKAHREKDSTRQYRDELVTQIPGKVEGDAAEDASKRDELLGLLAQARASTRARERHAQQIEEHEHAGQRMREHLQAMEDEGKRLSVPIPDPVFEDISEHDRAVELAIAEMRAPIPGYSGPSADGLASQLAELEADLSARREELADCAKASRDADRDLVAANRALDVAASERNAAAIERSALDRQSAEMKQRVGESTCRHCGEADPLGELDELAVVRTRQRQAAAADDAAAAAHDAAASALQAKQDAVRQFAGAWRTAQRNADAAAAKVETARTSLDHAKSSADGWHATVMGQRRAALDNAKRAHAAALRRAEAENGRHNHALSVRAAQLQSARARWVAARSALTAWQAQEAPKMPPIPGDVLKIEADLSAVNVRIEARQERARMVASLKAADARAAEALDLWRLTCETLTAVEQTESDLAAASYRPIEDAARSLMDGSTLPTPYFAGPDSYGAEVEGKGRISYHALSESEQRCTAAALVFAFAVVARQLCRLVLLDGLEVVQTDHRAPLLAAFVRAHRAGLVDNVIATMHTSSPGEVAIVSVEGVSIHEVSWEGQAEHAHRPLRALDNGAELRETRAAMTYQPLVGDIDCPF